MALEIVAHRGASGDAPENTMAAVELAWSQQADAVEIDVRLTKDGQIVAFHDENTLRITGQNHEISSATLAELKRLDAGRWKGETWRGEEIPTLSEVLESVVSGKRLYVEIKCGVEIVPYLAAELPTVWDQRRVVVISYEFDVLVQLRRLMPDLIVLQVVRLSRTPNSWQEATPSLAERIGSIRDGRLNGLDIGITELLEVSTVSQLLAENFQLCTWTINDASEALRLEEMGIHAVTTDFPGRLRRELAALRKPNNDENPLRNSRNDPPMRQ